MYDESDDIHESNTPSVGTGDAATNIPVIETAATGIASTATTGEGVSCAPDPDIPAHPLVPFLVYWDAEDEEYKMGDPVVFVGASAYSSISITTPSAISEGDNLELLVYKTSSGDYEAEIGTNPTLPSGATAVLKMLVAQINSDGTIVQCHVGAVALAGISREYVRGENSNVVLTDITTGTNAGKTAIDVYYV